LTTRYLLDTNVIIDNKKGLIPAVEFLTEEIEKKPNVEVIYSTIVEAELFSFHGLTEQDEIDFRDALDMGEIIEVNSIIALKAGALRQISKSKHNKKLHLPDAIIAATAMECSAILVTRNYDDFKHLQNEGLEIYNPFG